MKLFEHIPKQEKTFSEFKVFLFNKLGQNKEKFRKFSTYPDTYKIPVLIEFLESKHVPVIEAINYYSYQFTGTATYEQKVIYAIVCEFIRLEKNVVINYIPF